MKLFSQSAPYISGKVTDTIWVNRDLNESFSFYAPESFKTSIEKGIIFIFDPAGRGQVGISPFLKSADTYGYALVCSNNSRNGPYSRNYQIADRLFQKILKDLKPNKKRIYASGFSGGARFATSLASGSQLFQGVLSCGAGLNLDSRGLPSIPSYSYSVIMGNEDMNYYELAFTGKYLEKLKMPHEIFVTEMKHQWPDEDQVLLAFDWMELEAYKNRIIPVDSIVVHRVYTKYLKRAEMMKKNDRLLSAHDEYLRILRNFRRYYNLDSVENLSNELRQSKAFRVQKKNNDILLNKEKELTNDFLNRFGADIEKNQYKMSWWESQISRLKKKQGSGSWMQQKMYSRLLYRIYALAIESVNFETYISSFEQKKYCYDLCILIYPKYHVPYLKQIDLALGAGHSDLALDYVEKLLSTGYETDKLISDVPTLKKLHENFRFQQLTKSKNTQ